MSDLLTRTLDLTLNPTSSNKRIESEYYVEGYATTFDNPYLLCEVDGQPIYERVSRHAFDGVDFSNVVLRYDHKGYVFARTSNHTMGLEITDQGLLVYADLSKTSRAKELYEDIAVGNVTKMSIQCTGKRTFDEATNTFTIERVGTLYDVSAVGIPANEDTSLIARDVETAKNQHKQLENETKRKRLALKLTLETI